MQKIKKRFFKLGWIATRLNIKNNPLNIVYWILLFAVIYYLLGLYGMNAS